MKNIKNKINKKKIQMLDSELEKVIGGSAISDIIKKNKKSLVKFALGVASALTVVLVTGACYAVYTNYQEKIQRDENNPAHQRWKMSQQYNDANSPHVALEIPLPNDQTTRVILENLNQIGCTDQHLAEFENKQTYTDADKRQIMGIYREFTRTLPGADKLVTEAERIFIVDNDASMTRLVSIIEEKPAFEVSPLLRNPIIAPLAEPQEQAGWKVVNFYQGTLSAVVPENRVEHLEGLLREKFKIGQMDENTNQKIGWAGSYDLNAKRPSVGMENNPYVDHMEIYDFTAKPAQPAE